MITDSSAKTTRSEVTAGNDKAWNADALAGLAAYARSQRTTGLFVVHHRRTVIERNWPVPAGDEAFLRRYVHGTNQEGALREDVASQQKSVVALLALMAEERGLLDVARPVSAYVGAGWSRASSEQERAIAVHHLLAMESGLRDDLTIEAPPGGRHHYNTPAYAVMLPVLEAAARQPLDRITQDWLTAPVGMSDTTWCRRGSEIATDLGNPRGLVTTPRDLARLGQVVLDGGVVDKGARVISQAQLQRMFVRSALNPAYGWLWWLNGGSRWVMPRRGEGAGSVVAPAPADAVFALGSENRVLMVVPSLNLVLVRLGQQAPDPDIREQLARLLTSAYRHDSTA